MTLIPVMTLIRDSRVKANLGEWTIEGLVSNMEMGLGQFDNE